MMNNCHTVIVWTNFERMLRTRIAERVSAFGMRIAHAYASNVNRTSFIYCSTMCTDICRLDIPMDEAATIDNG